MKKSTQARKLTQYHYNKLIKLAFIMCLVTKESQFLPIKKQLKKQKQLFKTCKQIMQLNNELVVHLNTKSTVTIEISDEKCTSICSSLANLAGTSIEIVKSLLDQLAAKIRGHENRNPETPIQTLSDMKNMGPQFENHYIIMISMLIQVLSFKTGNSIDQTVGDDANKTTPLSTAIIFGDLSLVRSLVKNGANPTFKPTVEIPSPIELSVIKSDAELVQYFIAQNKWQQEFIKIFFHSTKEKNLPFLKILVESGFKLNVNVDKQKYAIIVTLLDNTVEFNEVALQAVDFNNLTNDQKIEFLKMAAVNKNPGNLSLLKNKGIDINTARSDGLTALSLLIVFKKEVAWGITNLCKNGADIEHVDNSGGTPILFASRFTDESAIRTLMSLGADITKQNLVSKDPLFQVIEKRCEDLAIALIEAGAPVDRTYKQGTITLLHIATLEGLVQVSKCLLHRGLDPKLISHNGNTYLHTSIAGKNLELVNTFLDAGVDIDGMNDGGLGPLAYACQEGYSEIALCLIERGANTTLSTPYGVSILALAMHYCDLSVSKAIINVQNIDINTPNDNGVNTVARAAITLKKLNDFIQLFEGKPIRIDIERAYSPLVMSIIEETEDVAKWLIENAKGDINHMCRSGYTALFAAIFKANSEMVALLIAHGATLFQVNDACYTPLMQAANEGYDEIVEYLLKAGADPNTATTGFSMLGDQFKMTRLLIGSSELFSDEQKICALDLAAQKKTRLCC